MTEILRLRNLARDPQAQADYALTLIRPRQQRDVLTAALRVLAETPQPQARPEILALYAYFAAGAPRRDLAGFVRSALLDALRPLVLPADVPLLLGAVTTYEFIPDEQAQTIRASALLALNDLDDGLARYHAARFLVDEHTSPMSGEPALTAIRVLASQDELLPLYMYALRPAAGAPLELVSECLRSLTTLPVALLPGLVARCGAGAESVLQIGLIDLLTRHQAGPQGMDYLAATLARPQDLDVYRYLVIAMLSAHQPELRGMVLEAAQARLDAERRQVLLQALEPFAGDRDVAAAIDRLQHGSSAAHKPKET